MSRRLLWAGPPLLAVGIILFAVLGRLPGQDPGAGGPGNHAELDSKVSSALRDVIERGRALYNGNRDYTGCYRIYEGGLLAVRPLLNHRPDLQRAISDGLAQAERIPINWQQAFALRKVIDQVRETVATPAAPPAVDKRITDTAPKDVKPEPPKDLKVEDKVILDKRPLDKDKVILDRKIEDKVKVEDKVILDKRPLDKDKVIRKIEDKLPPDGLLNDKKAADKLDLDKRPPVDAAKVPLDRKVEDKRPLDKAPADRKADDKRREDKAPADRKIETDKKVEKEPPADQASVKGQVLFQGKPLTSGFVTFVDPDGRKYSASIRADGSYAFKSVTIPPGEYRVIIENSVTLGKGQVRGAEVPRQYQSPETTPLTMTLTPGKNQRDLNLR